jgi:hypothetical protein
MDLKAWQPAGPGGKIKGFNGDLKDSNGGFY